MKIMRAEARSQSVIVRVTLSILPTPTHYTCPPYVCLLWVLHCATAWWPLSWVRSLAVVRVHPLRPARSPAAFIYIPSGLFVNVDMQGCDAGVHVCDRVWGWGCGRGGVGEESTLVGREGRGRGRVECVVVGDRGVGELGCVEAVYSQVSTVNAQLN